MIDAQTMEQVQQQLSSRAQLFEDPRTYLDGVQDALDSLQELEARTQASAPARGSLRLIEDDDDEGALPSGTAG